ncbi:FG-GAP and VCBS repeat-containing protein [Streptomyces sp. E11-3]|uniref:VCBS repeat-containing protein n=1 Tax=Streptomyces sp. E11-3 TaxID=3110112 RepID=UPI003980BF70
MKRRTAPAALVTTGVVTAALLLGACGDTGGRDAKQLPSPSPTPSGSPGELRQGPERPPAGKASAKPRTGDLNGDGFDDLAVQGAGHIAVVYGSADGPRVRTRATVRMPDTKDPSGIPPAIRLERADLDHDGFTDLLATLTDGRQYALWGGARGVSGPRLLDTGYSVVSGKETSHWTAGAVGDVDGDGSGDVFQFGAEKGPAGTVHYGPFDRRTGEPARRQPLEAKRSADSEPYQVTAGDFDGDGRDDLTVRFRWTDPENEGDGDTAVTDVLHFRGGARKATLARRYDRAATPSGIACDVDGDGTDEMCRVSFASYEQELALGIARGSDGGPGTRASTTVTFRDLPRLKGPDTPSYGGVAGRTVGDVTGDGKPDLVLGATGANDNQGLLFVLPDLAHATSGSPLQAFDLDSPGVVGENKPHARNRFRPRPPLLDVNGDGRLDVVATAQYDSARLWVLPGADSGLDARGTWHFTLKDLGIRP